MAPARKRADPAPAPITGDDDTFLADVRRFLARELTADLRAAGRGTIGVHAEIAASRVWYHRLARRGWLAPTWPVAYGGTGWTVRQRFLFDRECAQNDAPILFAAGVRSIGPLLIELGDAGQRARYIPAILAGDDLWCQGFSEPGAGSDLAAIRTRAVRDGADYVLDGAKIWTTGAQYANRMFAIVRTATAARAQEGLTFLLLDMASPGLSIRPIIDIAGHHEFNEVRFEGVRVPVANRIGAEGDGWAVAKRLMQLARANNTPAALVRRVWRRAQAALQDLGPQADPALGARLSAMEVELLAFEALERDALPAGRPDVSAASAPSLLKLVGSELHQRVAELAMEVAGPHAAAAWMPGVWPTPMLEQGAHAMAKHLSVRAATIYSGTSEVQRNVIAQTLFGRFG
ncbi:acyl-CoA dehydrogenase family protein [Zavarzinia sp. CC-PAN008]|uniref:acyl-CoA dehydrogenase family protein n=1 Tax=Zavarzinia sp. CC-PAN008 TaxID=3243332 RepID=UPI003F743E33